MSERFDIDVSIVRIAFVVLAALWGFGVALYLVMWAFIPSDRSASVSPEMAAIERRKGRVLAYIVLIAIGVLMLTLFFALVGLPKVGGGVTAGWLIFLVVVAIISLRSGDSRLSLLRAISFVFLGVLSLSILFVGGVLAFLASTNVPFAGGDGVHQWQPTALSEVATTYRTQFGSSTLDLSDVRFSDVPTRVTISTTVGQNLIIIPANVVVDLHSHVGLGTIELMNDGPGDFRSVPLGTRVTARTPRLVLDASVGIGVIKVERLTP